MLRLCSRLNLQKLILYWILGMFSFKEQSKQEKQRMVFSPLARTEAEDRPVLSLLHVGRHFTEK